MVETAWPLSLRRTLKGDYPFVGPQFRNTLTMLSIGFRAQIYPPLLQEHTACIHSQPTAWNRDPPLQEDEAFELDALQGSKRCWSKQPEQTWSLLTWQCQQPKHHSSPSNHRNNQPLCRAAACPDQVHASSQRCATTTQWAAQSGPSLTSHQPQGSCWASSNPVPSYHSDSFTPYSTKLIKF